MSYLVAWFINELSPRIRAVVTLIFYAPSISGQVYLIWGTLFDSDAQGWVNATLIELGMITEPIAFFQDASYVMPLCIIVALWTSLGTAFLSFIAGLQGVDRSLYEAGAVDGVRNRWQELWYITLPYIRPQLLFAAVTSITGAFNIGPAIDILCGTPSTNYVAWTMMHHLNDSANVRLEMGYACTIATVLFVLMVAANRFFQNLIGKVGHDLALGFAQLALVQLDGVGITGGLNGGGVLGGHGGGGLQRQLGGGGGLRGGGGVRGQGQLGNIVEIFSHDDFLLYVK